MKYLKLLLVKDKATAGTRKTAAKKQLTKKTENNFTKFDWIIVARVVVGCIYQNEVVGSKC